MVNLLPQPGAGQQYQLWAIAGGVPEDAFAITLEKTGGSPSPTLTALYVMGKV